MCVDQLRATLTEYMPAPMTLFLIGCLICTCIYLIYHFSHWTRQNVPEFKWNFPKDVCNLYYKRPLHEREQERYDTYGGLYGRYDGMTAVITVSDPVLLKRILISDFLKFFPNRRDMRFREPTMNNTLFVLEGNDWKRVRAVVSASLNTQESQRLLLYLLEECCNNLCENIAKTIKENKDIDCQRMFRAFTLDSIAKCAFGITINSLQDENNAFTVNSKELFKSPMNWRSTLTVHFPIVMKLFGLSVLNSKPLTFYRDVVRQMIKERENIEDRKDFLKNILDFKKKPDDPNNNNKQRCEEATCDSGNSNISTDTTSPKKSKYQAGPVSSEEILSQCVSFFTAGFESTTSLLSYAVYNLAMNEEYQAMAFSEVESILKNSKGVMSADCLSKMKYLEAVINECLRLCPSMVRYERRVAADYVLGSTNIRLKKGMLVSIPVYAIHRDPRYYPEPDKFKPERFYEPHPERPEYVHFPFGHGQRACIGRRFVLKQVKMCLAKILIRYHLSPAATTPADLKYIESMNILRADDVQVSMSERPSMEPESEMWWCGA